MNRKLKHVYRWAAKKQSDIEMVDGIYLDQPQRQVVAVDEIFIGAIKQRLERLRRRRRLRRPGPG